MLVAVDVPALAHEREPAHNNATNGTRVIGTEARQWGRRNLAVDAAFACVASGSSVAAAYDVPMTAIQQCEWHPAH